MPETRVIIVHREPNQRGEKDEIATNLSGLQPTQLGVGTRSRMLGG